MEEESHFDALEYERNLDRGIEDVMPASWAGHSRLAVDKLADGLTKEELRFARKVAGRVHRPESPKAVAKASIKETVKKLR